MKIYILPVNKRFQPRFQRHRFPKHNKDYGVEQDFYQYLLRNKNLITERPDDADWYYLPVYWTRWHVNHDYAKSGLEELQEEVDRALLDDSKTFTICQYSDGPLVNLGTTITFLASRKAAQGIDIPLLCTAHRKPLFKPSKKYLASFMGRLSNHPLRAEMAKRLAGRNDMYIYDGIKSTRSFVRTMLKSYVALCPRGYGGSSFRFFEAMQLGVTPFLIGDLDIRPFKQFIEWDTMSLFSRVIIELEEMLDSLSKGDLITMGQRATEFWQTELTYQRWCKYVFKELKALG